MNTRTIMKSTVAGVIAVAIVGIVLVAVSNDSGEVLEFDETLEVDYLEYRQLINFNLNGTRHFIDAEVDHSEDYFPTLDFSDDIEYQESRGIIAKHNGVSKFVVSFWQVDPDFRNGDGENDYVVGNSFDSYDEYKFLTDNWQRELEYTRIHGLIGQDNCLNNPVVCFDRIDEMIVLVHELDPNMKVNYEYVIKQNARVHDSERIDSDTVLFRVYMDDLMPELEKDHYVVPYMTMWINFFMIEDVPCMWDSNPRLCALEMKLAEHELHLGDLQ